MTVDRKRIITQGLDLSRLKGIEIGPLDKPLVTRQESSVFYADHTTTEQIKAKYARDPNVNLDAVPNIDIALGNRTLAATAGAQSMDYIIASHVIEHVPDLVRFLIDTHEVLKIGGVLCLAIPDKRYTFDAFRRETFLDDVKEAYRQESKRPSLDQVIDHVRNVVKFDRELAWNNYGAALQTASLKHKRDSVSKIIRDHSSGEYIDCHCWIFSPDSFVRLSEQIFSEFNISYKIRFFQETPRPLLEFYVQLEKF